MTDGTLERDVRPSYGVRGATHAYSSVPVLVGVDFELEPGTIHGLVGENGAGKSTLVNILYGVVRPVQGQLYLGDETIALHSPAEAQRIGVAVVHQDVQLFPELDVMRNVYGVNQRLPRGRWSRRIDWQPVEARLGELFGTLGIEIPLRRRVAALDLAERRMVEIARAMVTEPRFLILDEPTASLESRAAKRVLDLLLRLRDEGLGVVFVSHRLNEVRRISDAVTVLRDGRVVGHLGSNPPEDKMATLMLGAQAAGVRGMREDGPKQVADEECALRIENLILPGASSPIDLEIYRGEVFGLTGLLGSGAETVVRMLGGAEPFQGSLTVFGRPVRIARPQDALGVGIGFIAEDRQGEGLVPDQSVAVNISLSSLGEVTSGGWVRSGRLGRRAETFRTRVDIRARSMRVPVKTLSGGNQQKVLVARCLGIGARILSIEEPTHGVDVGAKAQIHRILREFGGQGGTIVVASTDVGELLNLCDRIAVCKNGSIAAILATHETRHADVLLAGVRDPEQLIDELMAEEAVASVND